MKSIILILFGMIPLGTIAQEKQTPFIDTVKNQVVICFDPLDSKELIRWNEERIYSKDYVNELINKSNTQEQIILNLEQSRKNDSIIYVNQVVINTEVKKHYKKLVQVNSDLNLELNEYKFRNKRNRNIAIVFGVVSLIEGLWIMSK